MSLLFLVAYTCSGLAGLIYEVAWTRLLTLHIGHSTAAASAVVAAFLGGLASGAGIGGIFASRVRPGRALLIYVLLELLVVGLASLVPLELHGLTPLLRWAYADATPGLVFPTVRLLSCLALVLVPAGALGATFPMAVRWLAHRSASPASAGSALYALNTVGAAAGSVLAGFTLIPAIGVSGTIEVGMTGSLAAAALAAFVWQRERYTEDVTEAAPDHQAVSKRTGRGKGERTPQVTPSASRAWLAGIVVGLSGFASLVHEIAWTRILALVLGPTTYAFAATLAAVVAGVAIGSAVSGRLLRRMRAEAHAGWLAIVLAVGSLTIVVTAALAGNEVPSIVARQVAASASSFDTLLRQGMLLTSVLILPTAICMGAAFPLAIAMADAAPDSAARRFGFVYALNTLGSVSGTLAAGFVLIPWLGLPTTLGVAAFLLVGAALLVTGLMETPVRPRIAGYVFCAMALVATVFAPAWDQALLASGVYLYAPFVPRDLDLETQLRAGTLLYYKDGAPATVSVKKLTGTTTLAVDGKTDASNRSDMLTQKLVAHLPLLLHSDPKTAAIIGLGSGVTLGAALSHPIERADVVEISPEVVEASRFFEKENRKALADPRAHLIVGDGRSHLLLSSRQYDVIISEPSNPWIAGVASLFTREFFEGARARLAPGGIICQWAHTYTISERDLRAIVGTFTSVFPNGTAWMVNDNDVLMVASVDPVEPLLANIATNWTRGQVAASLAEVGATEPFHVLSLFSAGPADLARYGAGADVLDDDRMRLEFSAPRELHNPSAGENDASFAASSAESFPAPVRDARDQATATQWRGRAAMMARSDAYSIAYDDYVRALRLDPANRQVLEGFTRVALLTGRAQDALSWVRSLTGDHPSLHARIATSRLLAAAGFSADAVEVVQEQCGEADASVPACEQLAALRADAGDRARLAQVVETLRRLAPASASTHYYEAVSALLGGDTPAALDAIEKAIAADATYAAAYDVAGAVHTRLGQADRAVQAFQTSLGFDPHDSTAYTNLGLLALAAGRRTEAINYFAEALWLTPDSRAARNGLAQARAER